MGVAARKLRVSFTSQNAQSLGVLIMMKPLGRIFGAIKVSRKRLMLWWWKMSDQEHRAIARRGAAISASVTVALILLPAIGVRYDEQRAEAEFRAEARMLAASVPSELLLESADRSNLLAHDWLQTVGYSVEREPRASLTRFSQYARDIGAVSTVAPDPIDSFQTADKISSEYKCLTQAVYYEAGYESAEGKLAVAEVIVNRVADHRYPNSICEVVYQGATRTTGCQFTFTCDGALRRKPNPAKWEAAKSVAAHVMMDIYEPRTANATHYHATYVDPIWNVGLVKTRKIGAHIFYRFPRGKEWVKARNAVAQKKAYRAQLAAYKARGYGVVPGPAEQSVTTSLQLSDTSLAPAP
jgi:spore germination cell wall hydrolase CwlJ-like protein